MANKNFRSVELSLVSLLLPLNDSTAVSQILCLIPKSWPPDIFNPLTVCPPFQMTHLFVPVCWRGDSSIRNELWSLGLNLVVKEEKWRSVCSKKHIRVLNVALVLPSVIDQPRTKELIRGFHGSSVIMEDHLFPRDWRWTIAFALRKSRAFSNYRRWRWRWQRDYRNKVTR